MSLIHRKHILRLQSSARTPKLLLQLGISPEDIAPGYSRDFWLNNADRLEYLFTKAGEGYRRLIKELHPDRNPANLEQCVKLTAIWKFLKKHFAAHGIPNYPLPKEHVRRMGRWSRKQGSSRIRRVIWPANIPPGLPINELARLLQCQPITARRHALLRGYQVGGLDTSGKVEACESFGARICQINF